MKLEIIIDKINKPILQIAKMVSKNQNLPLLQGILMTAEDGFLSLTSTNLETGINYKIPAKIEKEGSVLVSGEIISKIFSNIRNSEKSVNLETQGENLIIETKRSKSTINTLPKEEYPNLPKVENGESLAIDKEILISGIKAVSFASAISDIKPEIASVYIYTVKDEIVFVSTDSYRLAEKRIKFKNDLSIKILIPYKNIGDIVKTLEDLAEGEIDVVFNGSIILFKNNYLDLTSRIIDGLFPDYKRIIPTESLIKVKILKQDLQDVLKTTTILSDKNNKIIISLNKEEQLVYFKTNNSQVGEASANIQAQIEGESIDMSFNYKHIQDSFNSLEKESIEALFTLENKPMILKNNNEDSFLYLVMPLNR